METGYTKAGARQLVLRRVAMAVEDVLRKIEKGEGEKYTTPLLENLRRKRREKNTGASRGKSWLAYRRKRRWYYVFVVAGGRHGVIRKNEVWKISNPKYTIWVDFPDRSQEFSVLAVKIL